MDFKCPGQDKRNLKVEIFECPNCGYKIELFSDEMKGVCPECKTVVLREVLPSCIDWCNFAEECVGKTFYDKYRQDKAITLREKLLKELENYFGDDRKRINHAKNVMNYAQELLREEKGDWHIVIPASILHDIGIKEAERKYGSSAGHLQEKEGAGVAKKILFKLGFKKEDIAEICDIIASHHSRGKINTNNFKILYDADCLVNLKDEVNRKDKNKLEKMINEIFLTDTGKRLARKIFLKNDGL